MVTWWDIETQHMQFWKSVYSYYVVGVVSSILLFNLSLSTDFVTNEEKLDFSSREIDFLMLLLTHYTGKIEFTTLHNITQVVK